MTAPDAHADASEARPPLGTQTACWPDEAATAAWTATLAERLCTLGPAADVVIEFDGPLGAGKTTTVRHLLRALGVTGRIKSPSYAIVEPYEVEVQGHPLNLWHFDFYRFADPREWEDAGFRELFAAPGLKLIEWADKVRPLLPVPDLECGLTPRLDGVREARLLARTPTGLTLLTGAAP